MTERRPPALSRGERIEVRVERPVYRGLGLARHQGLVVFVPGAIPGDRAQVEVEEATPGYVRARLVDLLEGGPGRREAPCAWAGRCGGCVYQGVDYEVQRRIKAEVLRDSLHRGGVSWEGGIEVVPSPEQGWRMRATLHPSTGRGRLRLGLHEAGSHRVVPIDRCLQLSPALNDAAAGLAEALDRPQWRGRLGDVELAESRDGGERVALLELRATPAEATRVGEAARRLPGLTGLGVLAMAGRQPRYVHLAGEPYLHAEVLGERLRFHVRSFFQGNRFVAEALAGRVRELLPAGGRVLDLFAGVGFFAVPVGRQAVEVRGVELAPTAVEDAAHNAEVARLPHVRVERGDVREALAGWRRGEDEAVVLDPPRTGAGAGVVRAIAERRPGTVVYVSCDPPTLARDLREFAAQGYRPDALSAFDLFPDTFHVETVVRLRPA